MKILADRRASFKLLRHGLRMGRSKTDREAPSRVGAHCHRRIGLLQFQRPLFLLATAFHQQRPPHASRVRQTKKRRPGENRRPGRLVWDEKSRQANALSSDALPPLSTGILTPAQPMAGVFRQSRRGNHLEYTCLRQLGSPRQPERDHPRRIRVPGREPTIVRRRDTGERERNHSSYCRPAWSGKTLTAESVAEQMQVPLIKFKTSSTGTGLEEALSRVLELAGRWKAILLLDECDVFLEQRSVKDFERNTVVAMFLQKLEYYEGILFMTTNRADNIDPAIRSRIHLTMNYSGLGASGRSTRWQLYEGW